MVVEVGEGSEEGKREVNMEKGPVDGDLQCVTEAVGEGASTNGVVERTEDGKALLDVGLFGIGEMIPGDVESIAGSDDALGGESLTGLRKEVGIHPLRVGARVGDLLFQRAHRGERVAGEDVLDPALADGYALLSGDKGQERSPSLFICM